MDSAALPFLFQIALKKWIFSLCGQSTLYILLIVLKNLNFQQGRDFSHSPGCQGSLSFPWSFVFPVFLARFTPFYLLCASIKGCHHTWFWCLLYSIIFMTHSTYLVPALGPFLSFLYEVTGGNSLLTFFTGVEHLGSFHIGDGTNMPTWLMDVCGPVSAWAVNLQRRGWQA